MKLIDLVISNFGFLQTTDDELFFERIGDDWYLHIKPVEQDSISKPGALLNDGVQKTYNTPQTLTNYIKLESLCRDFGQLELKFYESTRVKDE
jgi:hypothetical protein